MNLIASFALAQSIGSRNPISPLPFSSALRRFFLSAIAVAGLLLVAACNRAPQASQPASDGGDWHEFQGTWTAAGNRQFISLGGTHRASIANFRGSLLLTGASRPGVGFRADAIVLNDSATGMIGRSVWTDDRGDQIYSELQGEGTSTGNKIVGTFLGGTGRYSGATGTYQFSWRFVLQDEEGNVEGQSVGLNGRIRAPSPSAAPPAGGTQP